MQKILKIAVQNVRKTVILTNAISEALASRSRLKAELVPVRTTPIPVSSSGFSIFVPRQTKYGLNKVEAMLCELLGVERCMLTSRHYPDHFIDFVPRATDKDVEIYTKILSDAVFPAAFIPSSPVSGAPAYIQLNDIRYSTLLNMLDKLVKNTTVLEASKDAAAKLA